MLCKTIEEAIEHIEGIRGRFGIIALPCDWQRNIDRKEALARAAREMIAAGRRDEAERILNGASVYIVPADFKLAPVVKGWY